MNATEQLEALTMRVGAKPGQVLLWVDLSVVEHPSEVLKRLSAAGYDPQLRYLELKSGLHVIALLKEEQHDPNQPIDEEYMLDEWESLAEQFGSEAVRLWRGLPRSVAA